MSFRQALAQHQESAGQGGAGEASTEWRHGCEAGGGSVAMTVPLDCDASVIDSGSSDALQQGEATGEVRGELN
jgi:hypothetical protein